MESRNKNVVFRKSMHGYNKKDVNDYIVRLSRDYFEKEKQLKSELHKKESEIKSAIDDKARIETEIDRIAERAAEAESQLAKARAEISELREANFRLVSSVEDLKTANATLRTKFEELQSGCKSEGEEREADRTSLANAMSVDLFSGGDFTLRSDKNSDAIAACRAIIEKSKRSVKTATNCRSDEFSAAVNELRVNADSANETASRLDLIRSELIESIDSEMDKIERLLLK